MTKTTLFVMAISVIALLNSCVTTPGNSNDHTKEVNGLKIRTSGTPGPDPNVIVFIHGDGGRTRGYHDIADLFGSEGDVAIILARPGCKLYDGRRSRGTHNKRQGYIAPHVKVIATALSQIRSNYGIGDNGKTGKLIVAGHSGGSALTSLVMSRHPGIIDGTVLAAFVADVEEWASYRGYSPKLTSLSPIESVHKIPAGTPVKIIMGTHDDNTPPWLAKDYVKRANEAGVNISLIEIPTDHNGTYQSDDFRVSIWELISQGKPVEAKKVPRKAGGFYSKR